MNDRDFVRAGMPPGVFNTTHEQTLFDRNLTALQSAAEILDRYRLPEGRAQGIAQSATETSAWRARYEVAPGAAAAIPDARTVTAEGQTAPGQGVRQVRYDQGVSPNARPLVQQDRPQPYSEVRTSVNTANKSASKDDTSRLLVIGAELAIAAVFVRLGMKHFAKNGITLFGDAQKVAKSAEAVTKAPSTPPTFTPHLGDLSQVPKSLLGPNGLPRVRTTERPDGPLRVG